MTETQNPVVLRRTALAVVGTLCGLGLWLVTDWLPEQVDQPRLVLFLSAWLLGFSVASLLACGPLRSILAMSYAIGHALVVAALVWWMSFRFGDVGAFLRSGHPIPAAATAILLPLPFIIAHERAPKGFRDYGFLFDQSWSMVLRGGAALVFAGLFWLLVFLSDAVLRLVGFELLGDLIDQPWFAFGFTGLTLGLAAGVLRDFETVIATVRGVILRLLRLMLPVIAVVIGLFLVLLVVQGPAEAFARLSAAATMIGIVLGAVTLITATIDTGDQSQGPGWMRTVARALALVLPVPAAMAGWAVWVRVAEHGWTPMRGVAAILCVIVIAYGLTYFAAALRPRGWERGQRLANTWCAVFIVVLSILWMTPALNVERMSAVSQVNRVLDGRTAADKFNLALLQRWGMPGARQVARLEQAAASGNEAARVAMLEDRPAPVPVDTLVVPMVDAATRATIGSAPATVVDAMPTYALVKLGRACRSGEGRCVFLRTSDSSGYFFWVQNTGGKLETAEARRKDETWQFDTTANILDGSVRDGGAVVRAILDGRLTFGPAAIDVLTVQDLVIVPRQ